MCTAGREPEMTASLAADSYVPTINLEETAEGMRNATSKERKMILGWLANGFADLDCMHNNKERYGLDSFQGKFLTFNKVYSPALSKTTRWSCKSVVRMAPASGTGVRHSRDSEQGT